MIKVKEREAKIDGDVFTLSTDLTLANMAVYKRMREYASRKNAIAALHEITDSAIRYVENGGLLYEEGKE